MTPRNTEYTKYDPPGAQVSDDALAQKYLLYTPPARLTGVFLQDCALAQIINETYHIISFCDLHKKIAKEKDWILSTDENVNVDFVQYAKDLGWKNKEVYKSTWSKAKEFPLQRLLSCVMNFLLKRNKNSLPMKEEHLNISMI